MRVPAARIADARHLVGRRRLAGPHAARSSDFYVARPGDSAKAINAQLARGKHLLLTPGIYDVDRSIDVKRPGTVVLGMGHATLTAVGGAVPLEVADRAGIVIAGVTIDAGTVESPALLRVGGEGRRRASGPRHPTR